MRRLALVLFFCMAGMLQATTFYVALNGNDSWSGTLAAPNGTNTDGPWRTLPHAQSVMNGSSTKTVTIRGGTYVLSGTMSFFSSSNGQTWIPYQNETPVIDGNNSYVWNGNGVSNLTIEGLTFQNFNSTSSNGLVIGIGGDHLTIRWNTFTNCTRYCVVGVLTNSLVDSNTVNGQNVAGTTGVLQTYTPFQYWDGSHDTTISHNLIQHTQGGAIAVPADNFVVDRNLLLDVNQLMTDWGAVYVSHGVSTHTMQLTNNRVDLNGDGNYATDSVRSFYLDDEVSNTTVSGNLCRRCGYNDFMIHGGHNNTITNNIFDMSANRHNMANYQNSVAGDPMNANVFTKNIVYNSACTWPQLWSISILSGAALPISSHNLYYSPCAGTAPNTGAVDSSPTNANPLFTDAANGDYSMPGGSPAFTVIGFAPLATDQGPLPNPFITTGTPPVISSFTATPSSITSGNSSSLALSSSGGTTCSINQGIGTVACNGTHPVSPAVTTSYIATVTNVSGSVTSSVTVTVTGSTVPAPTITSFTASPSTPVVPGTAVTLTWTSTNGSTATLNGSSVALNGSQVVSPTTTTAYALVVSNSTGIASQTVTVSVGALPVISSFTATPSTIALGGSSTLALASTGGTSCSINQGVGTVACNSSTPVSPLTSKLYTATVTNSFGSKTAQVLVGVSISALVGASVVNGQVVIH